MASREKIKTVDLFCGAGGLTCGFEGAEHPMFQTVLGLDNEPSAIRIFNRNFSVHGTDALLPIGRLADATWFKHSAEIRLYYLVHVAYSTNDSGLKDRLRGIGIHTFLHQLQACDRQFQNKLASLSQEACYLAASKRVPSGVLSLALPRALMNRLSLRSLRNPDISLGQLPWTEEYEHLAEQGDAIEPENLPVEPQLQSSAEDYWNSQMRQLFEAAAKTGNTQNRNNAKNLALLQSFFSSEGGRRLAMLWAQWNARRETIRAHFCIHNKPVIDREYFGDHKVKVVLGGPPCKGFSRIGRPVIESLRKQGVHAWSNTEFGDERNALMCQYVLFLEAFEPEIFLFENVANFQSALRTPGGTLDAPSLLMELIDALAEGDLHYDVGHKVLNARHHAVPQDRKRFIMLGVRRGPSAKNIVKAFFKASPPENDVPLAAALTGLSDAKMSSSGSSANENAHVYRFIDDRMPRQWGIYLNWIMQPHPRTGSATLETDAHVYRPSREDDLAFLDHVAPGVRWMDLKVERSSSLTKIRDVLTKLAAKETNATLRAKIEEVLEISNGSLMLRLLLENVTEKYKLNEQHLLLDGYLKNGGTSHGDWFERLAPDRPCKTIVAHIGKDTYGYWHPTAPRAISIREAARVQSFPDWFSFGGEGIVNAYTMIGNAVPPLLAKALAERIVNLNTEFNMFDDSHAASKPKRIKGAKTLREPV